MKTYAPALSFQEESEGDPAALVERQAEELAILREECQRWEDLLTEALDQSQQDLARITQLEEELACSQRQLRIAEEKLEKIAQESQVRISGKTVAALKAELEQASDVLARSRATMEDLSRILGGMAPSDSLQDRILGCHIVMIEEAMESIERTLRESSR